jgi:hypothetical protein
MRKQFIKTLQNSLIINHRNALGRGGSSGFFSLFFQILDNLKYCSENNLKPVIKLDKSFYNGDWEDFFETINDGVATGNTINSDYFLLKNFLVNLDIPYLKLWELLTQQKRDEVIAHRQEVNNLIQNFIKPSKEILNMVNQHIDNCNNNTLAVHIRTTDYNYYNIENYFNAIDRDIDNYNKIFVASDSTEAINLVKNKYKNVYFLETNLRATKNNDNWVGSIVEGVPDKFVTTRKRSFM